MPFEPPMANCEGDDYFLGVDMGEEDMGEDNMTELLIGDMFNNMWATNSPRASPRRHDDEHASREGSPAAQPHRGAGTYGGGDPAGLAVRLQYRHLPLTNYTKYLIIYLPLTS